MPRPDGSAVHMNSRAAGRRAQPPRSAVNHAPARSRSRRAAPERQRAADTGHGGFVDAVVRLWQLTVLLTVATVIIFAVVGAVAGISLALYTYSK